MIRVEKLSYGFPAKDLYHDISFSLETGQHCALIGSNGSGYNLTNIFTTEKYTDQKITELDMPVSSMQKINYRIVLFLNISVKDF